MRDTLIGRPIRNAKENPVVVFTKHGAYRIATKQFDDVDIKTKKNLVVTTFKFE